MADSLPRFIVLGRPTGGGLYFQYVTDGQFHRRLQLSSREAVSEQSFTKLEVVRPRASSAQQLVHIRSSYNNKFLVLQSPGMAHLIAGADEPEEDLSKWSCTLFRAHVGTNGLTLSHTSRDTTLNVHTDSNNCLSLVRSFTPFFFQVTDISTLAILPKYIAFKGDNNQYLVSRNFRTQNRLQFASDNLMDPRVHHQCFIQRNGLVRLRSLTFGRFWRKSNPEWIFGDSSDTTDNDLSTVFRPVRLDSEGNTIALLNMGNNKYCKRRIQGGQPRLKDTLIASTTTVVPQAVMEVEEAIREREITDIVYREDDARVYDFAPWRHINQETYNFDQNVVRKRLLYRRTKLHQETFSSSHSWKVALSMRLRVRIIPVLVQGTINFNVSYSGNVEWSEMTETTETVETEVFVDVDPMSKAVVTLILSKGTIDVPYSYTQRDILVDGSLESKRMHDGLFSGVSSDNIRQTIRQESLSGLSVTELEELKIRALDAEGARAADLSSKL